MIETLIEAVERAVDKACRELRMNPDVARKLIRAEISYATLCELRMSYRRDQMPPPEELRGERPISFRGVNYYVVNGLPEDWRIIAPVAGSGGMGAVTIYPAEQPVSGGANDG